MNESNPSSTTSANPWPNGDHRMPVPETSMLPGSDKAPQSAVSMLKTATQGAHDTIDRLADSAEPVVQQIGERMTAAGAALHAKSEQLRETRDEWMEGARTTVRASPLTSVVTAFLLGAVFSRIIR